MASKSTFVKKLDVPVEFDAIQTNIKTLATLKKHERERYSVWYNHYKDLNQLVPANKQSIAWVGTHHEKILKYIRDTYGQGAQSTLRNHLEGLANVLLAINKVKYKEVVRPLFNTGLSIQQLIDKENEESKLTDKDVQNFVSYEQLVKQRDILHEQWMKDPKNLRLNMYHVILAVNTYIPPLRLNWVDMQFYPERVVNGKAKTPNIVGPPPENTTNYLWEYARDKFAIVMNYDKIENKRQKKKLDRQIMKRDDEIVGVTNGKKLNELSLSH